MFRKLLDNPANPMRLGFDSLGFVWRNLNLLWFTGIRHEVFLMAADDKGKFDELVEDKGVKILIDPKALMHVIGTKMDYVDDKLRY